MKSLKFNYNIPDLYKVFSRSNNKDAFIKEAEIDDLKVARDCAKQFIKDLKGFTGKIIIEKNGLDFEVIEF